jgi:hypothetical protein
MELRFACPTCGQHLSATRAQIGMEAQCPSCNAGVVIPIQSTLPPKLPDYSPQPEQPPRNPQGAAVKRTKARPIKLFGTIVVIGAVAVAGWFVYDSHKPELFAKAQVTPKVLGITNGNDTAWESPKIILNDAFASPTGVSPANETRQLPLSVGARSDHSGSPAVLAEGFKTVDGKEYKNAKLSRVEPDGIVITFSGGIVKIPFAEMSPDIQKKYGYDPAAAADFQKQAYEAGVRRSQEIVEAQAAVNARNAKLGAQAAADVKAAAVGRAISGFSLSAHESGSEGSHDDTWRTDWGSYDQTTTHGKRVKVSVHDVGGSSAVCTIHVYFVAKSVTKNMRFIYADEQRQLSVNRGMEESVSVDAPRITSRILHLQALGEEYASGAEKAGWIVTGSINGQIFGMYPSNSTVGSDAGALIDEFQNRKRTADKSGK